MCLGDLGQVRSIESDGTLVVDVSGRLHSVAALVLDRPATVGEWVLVHSGFALAVVSPDVAWDALEIRAAGSA